MTQLTLFGDDAFDDSRPLPQIVAERWGFALSVSEANGETVYAIQDWIAGLAQVDTTKASILWQRMSGQTVISKYSLPYEAKDGRLYDRDHTNDRGLYVIAQSLRQLKSRTLLAQIKEYLADAGAFADEARRNPQGAADKFQAIADGREYKRLIASGMSHEETLKWIDVRAKQKRGNLAIKDTWAERGAVGRDYPNLSNAVMLEATGKTATDMKRELQVTNPRDYLSAAENAAVAGVELFAGLLHNGRDSRGYEQLRDDIADGAGMIDRAAIEAAFSKRRVKEAS
jgi:hypothetical protein